MAKSFPEGMGDLGWSKVAAYENCPACFEKQYILKLPTPVEAVLALGSGVHSAVQTARQSLIDNQPVLNEECLEVGMSSLQSELGREDRQVDLQKFESESAVEDRLRDVVAVALRDIVGQDQVDGRVLIDVERSIDYEGVFDFPFRGKFDAVVGLRKPGAEQPILYMFKDLKTAGQDTAMVSSANLQQLATYIMPFAGEGRGTPWAVIERVTTTQHPTARSFGLQPSDEQMAAVKVKIERVADEIISGRFPEIPGRFCSFRHKLPSVTSFSNTLSPEPEKKSRRGASAAAEDDDDARAEAA